MDARALPRVAAWKAVAALVAFYLVISAAYILGASYLPQYDPAVERGKIEKIVKPKLETPEARRARLEALLKKSEELQVKTETLQAKLEKYAPASKSSVGVQAAADELIDRITSGKTEKEWYEDDI